MRAQFASDFEDKIRFLTIKDVSESKYEFEHVCLLISWQQSRNLPFLIWVQVVPL
jgi:hypothetical protein